MARRSLAMGVVSLFWPALGLATDRSDLEIGMELGGTYWSEAATSDEGRGYRFDVGGRGIGIRLERRVTGELWLDVGYFGTSNDPIPSGSPFRESVYSSVQRGDLALKYALRFGSPGWDVGIVGLAGVHAHALVVQPQSTTVYYTTIHRGGAVGAGFDANLEDLRLFADVRLFAPLVMEQRYGDGTPGGFGQSGEVLGSSLGAGARVRIANGSSIGVAWRRFDFRTSFRGAGLLRDEPVTGIRARHASTSVALTLSTEL